MPTKNSKNPAQQQQQQQQQKVLFQKLLSAIFIVVLATLGIFIVSGNPWLIALSMLGVLLYITSYWLMKKNQTSLAINSFLLNGNLLLFAASLLIPFSAMIDTFWMFFIFLPIMLIGQEEPDRAKRIVQMQLFSFSLFVISLTSQFFFPVTIELSESFITAIAYLSVISGFLLTVFGLQFILRQNQKLLNETLQNRLHSELQIQNLIQKDKFIATISHELRTPLNGINGILQALEPHIADDKGQFLLNNALQATQSLKFQVNSLLDSSMLQTGNLELHLEASNLKEILQNIETTMLPLAIEKKLDLRFSTKGVEEKPVILDRQRFKQIAFNLISNAIKFTDQGSVSVLVLCDFGSEHNAYVRLVVKDTGHGIHKAFLPYIFDQFSQEPFLKNRYPSGTGQGLYITHQLIQRMNAEIAVESQSNQGTRFIVDFSFEVAKEHMAGPIQNTQGIPDLSDVRVIYAEDNLLNQLVVKEFSDRCGIQLEIVNNGQEFMDLIRVQTQGFDLVLMDFQMPFVDGTEAAHWFRKIHKNLEVAIIGVTANANETSRQQALDSGMNDILIKPFMLQEFIDKLVEYLPESKVKTAKTKLTKTPQNLDKALGEIALAQSTKAFDFALLQKEFGYKESLIIKMLTIFRDDSKKTLGHIKQQLQQENRDTLATQSHKLCGSSRFIFANDLSHACRKLEEIAAQASLEDCKQQFLRVDELHRAVLEQIQEILISLGSVENIQ